MKLKKIVVATLLALAITLAINSVPNNAQAQQNGIENFREVDDTTFDQLNPLKITGSDQAQTLSTPGGIIGRVLEFAFPIAGLILFIMIIWGGFETLTQAAGKKSTDAGKQRITAAVIGFGLLFTSYWIIRVIETVLGVKILF